MASARKRQSSSAAKPKQTDMTEENIKNEEDEQIGNTFQDKLDYIDKEIRKLHVFCVNSGYSSTQIEKFVLPFSTSIKTVRKEKWRKRAIYLGIFIAAVAVLFNIDPVYRIMNYSAKAGAIAILPLWDWTYLYEGFCMVENPLYDHGKDLTISDCEVCDGATEIERLKDLTSDDFLDKYLKRDIPIIVVDGTRGWLDPEKYTFKELSQAYSNDPDLKQYASCLYSSNGRFQFKDHYTMLRKASQFDITNFYAHWENCFPEAARSFRHFYKRPYFLPRVFEMALNNWVFIASGYKGKRPRRIPIEYPAVILAQVKGSMQIIISPREPCQTVCVQLTELLEEGDILVVTDFIWAIEYVPQMDTESITIGIGGSFD